MEAMTDTDRNPLVLALLDPEAYPVPTRQVELAETHISLVFLLDRDVFKLKKPLDLGFLDFSTLERRRHFCEEEVRLNRRLAPDVYRGVVPIRRTSFGIQVGGEDDSAGEIIEYAVHMVRLPDDARLADRLAAGLVTDSFWPQLGERLARFHAAAERSKQTTLGATFARIAENARGNLIETAPFVGAQTPAAISRTLHTRVRDAVERALTTLRPIFEERAARGIPCDTHGDLRLDHVYHFPERTPPDDLVIIDCVEFSERFRHADPISDVAFLAMDLSFAGEHALADALTRSYLEASGDTGTLFPWYIAYRSAVRAKIDHLTIAHADLTEDRRDQLVERALGHWLFALGSLEPPIRRPALVLVGGPPGCGKSTVAEGVHTLAQFEWIRSDLVRRELFPSLKGAALYSPERVGEVYSECLERADRIIAQGGRALIDATFHLDAPRQAAVSLALSRRVPCVFLELTIDRATAHARIAGRAEDSSLDSSSDSAEGPIDNPSDADAQVHDQLVAEWEVVEGPTARVREPVSAEGDRTTVLAAALSKLNAHGLFAPE